MYGLSDHLKRMPLTRFSALRQGSSRYSGAIETVYEHTFVPARRIGAILAQTRHGDGDTLTAGGGWNRLPTRVGIWGPTSSLYSESDRRWTATTRLVPAPRRAGRESPTSADRGRGTAPAERVLRRGRVRPRHGAPHTHHRAARPGRSSSAPRPQHHREPAALHCRDATRRDDHEPGHRCSRRARLRAHLRTDPRHAR